MAATIKDIAARAGCGVGTVSSYLNGGSVRPRNRDRIEKAIKELNYVVNETARQLKTNRTRMVGAIIPELNSTFCASVLSEIEDILRQHGYALLVCDCRTDKGREQEAVELMVNRRVDGLFVIPVDFSGNNFKDYLATGKPLITIDRDIEPLNCDSVCVDNREAIQSAVTFLVGQGHRKIGLMAGPEDVIAAQQRVKGYLQACEENGLCLQESLLFRGEDRIETGTEGVKKLWEDNPDMTALVAASYSLTVGALIGINEKGISVPQELSLIGFDNPQFAKAAHPQLTIVNQPIREIGKKAAELMLQRLQEDRAGEASPSSGQEHIWLNTEILPGHSVKKVYVTENPET